jgi:hypothetical protein
MAPKKNAVQDVQDDAEELNIVSFSEDIAEAEAPEPLPERDYPATIADANVGETKNGDPMFIIKFKINEDDYPADFDAGNAPGGKTLTHYLVAQDSPAGRHRVKQFCQAVGAPMSKKLRAGDFIGLTAQITIKHEEYEGVPRERIQRVNAG